MHDWLMEILRRLPTDGLIKREGPLSRLKGSVMFIIAMMNATEFIYLWAVNVVNDNHVNLFGPTLASSVSRLHHGLGIKIKITTEMSNQNSLLGTNTTASLRGKESFDYFPTYEIRKEKEK